MITADQEARLLQLEAYVVESAAKSPREFWDGFRMIAQGLDEEAFEADSDPFLLERYTSLLANADEAGFVVPDDALDHPWVE